MGPRKFISSFECGCVKPSEIAWRHWLFIPLILSATPLSMVLGIFSLPVELVAYDRVVYRREVNAYLVGPAVCGVSSRSERRQNALALCSAVRASLVFLASVEIFFLSFDRLLPSGMSISPYLFCDYPPDEGVVSALCIVWALNCAASSSCASSVFSDDHNPGGLLVEAMDYAGAKLRPPDGRELIRMMEKGRGEGAVKLSGPGMDG